MTLPRSMTRENRYVKNLILKLHEVKKWRLKIIFLPQKVFHTNGRAADVKTDSRMRNPLFSSAITLLLTHKWPQYFSTTQPTNHLKSLTTLFQIVATRLFLLLSTLCSVPSNPPPLPFNFLSPFQPPLMPAINPQGGWNWPSQ